eukprot:GHVU01031890.1.p1 GENE.GHVU01031890.1~~GHVU01031890.1.p1  ORF type:complete len:120 (-),score=8.89 GHVU01031890.1:557-916(-)
MSRSTYWAYRWLCDPVSPFFDPTTRFAFKPRLVRPTGTSDDVNCGQSPSAATVNAAVLWLHRVLIRIFAFWLSPADGKKQLELLKNIFDDQSGEEDIQLIRYEDLEESFQEGESRGREK